MKKIKKKFKYIDLFAGVGGFHQAMRRLGGECVYFCEKNPYCIEVYKNNYDLEGQLAFDEDITKRKTKIPNFDVLCAGFPCQPFSKAGNQMGFEDKGRGDLFYDVCRIIDEHPECKFLILENVRNLADDEDNWKIIRSELMERNFIITEKPIILSPHQFGIPQIRERVYILGIRREFKDEKTLTNCYIHLEDLKIKDMRRECPANSIGDIIEAKVDKKYHLPHDLVYLLDSWSEFKTQTQIGVVGKPIWMSSFGMGFDDTETFYKHIGYYDIKRDKQGNIEYDEEGKPKPKFPDWKKQFVDFNRTFYLKNRAFIDDWANRHQMNDDKIRLHRKFEWNCGLDCENIRDGIIQIRQSGVRVKRPNFFPSLVAMRNTPIIWDTHNGVYRYITPKEAAKLQSYDDNIIFLENDNETYKQLGNSVNVNIIQMLTAKLFNLGRWRKPNEKKD